MNYAAAIEWLFSTQMFGIKLGLDGPRELLRRYLAYPSKTTKVIHVAGTNGKGSTCAFIDAIARACGMRTGLFTSPHLIDYRERVQVSGDMIDEERTLRHLIALRKVCESMEHHPTFFEITLALAMKHFAETECELIILETGMGGRLDATTAIPADVCVITPIGLDHTQWLGDTIAKIAAEKAGIILPKIPVISAPQHPDAAEVIAMVANENRAPLHIIDQPATGYPLSLSGPHQPWNAATALAALHALGIPLRYDAVQYGLSHTRWPGRFEVLSQGEKSPVILDGAHNPHAAAALAETWQQLHPHLKANIIFSAVSSKDITGVLALLAPLAEHVHLCPVNSPRAVPVSELAASLPIGTKYTVYENFSQAFDAVQNEPHKILICGSLYLVGQARAYLLGGNYQPSTQ